MYKVLLTDKPNRACLTVFDRYESIEATIIDTPDPQHLKEIIPEYDAIIVRSPTTLSAEIIRAGTRLRFIGRAGVGYDNIDIAAADAQGIVVMNAPTGNIITTAEHTIGLLLSLVRHIPQAHTSLVNGEWQRSRYRGTELFGKTAGIIGLGRVGSEVAKRLTGFRMRVIAADPYLSGEEMSSIGVTMTDLDTLLTESDVITIHVPLNQETESLLSDREFDLMRDGVFLVNCARGGIVDEQALLRALDSGKVAATAADVFVTEPPKNNPLLSHPRSVFTPHIGAATLEARTRIAVEIAESVSEALVNGILRSVVNPSST